MANTPIPDTTCQAYIAQDQSCSAINTCRTCNPDGSCNAVKNYTTIGVTQFGSAVGADKIQAELYARGPLSCQVDAMQILNYTGT